MSNPVKQKLDYLRSMDISLYMNIIEEEEKSRKALKEASKPLAKESEDEQEEQGKAS